MRWALKQLPMEALLAYSLELLTDELGDDPEDQAAIGAAIISIDRGLEQLTALRDVLAALQRGSGFDTGDLAVLRGAFMNWARRLPTPRAFKLWSNDR